MATDSLFFGYINDHDIFFVQNWAGPVLANMHFVDQITDLAQCHKKIILLSTLDGNFEIDLLRILIQQKNYLIFVDPREVTTADYQAMIADCPEAAQFPVITGGIDKNKFGVNLNTFHFVTLTDTNQLKAELFTTPYIFDNKTKPFKFLYLNGHGAYHRNVLWHQLSQTGVLDYALKSYLGYFRHNVTTPNLDVRGVSNQLPYDIPVVQLPAEYECSYRDIDDSPLFNNDPRNFNRFNDFLFFGTPLPQRLIPIHYINTYFSLVTETTVNDSYVFVSEKTYKPILAGHPFIILGPPGHYQELHNLGYQTFHPIINESFAYEDNLERRIDLVVKEVQRLCSIDLLRFHHDVKEICLFNQKYMIESRSKLFQKVHHELNQFLTQVIHHADLYFNS